MDKKLTKLTKLVHDVALISTALNTAGLTVSDAEVAAQYCLVENFINAKGLSPLKLSKMDAKGIIWFGFTWEATPEGHDYWHNRIKDIITIESIIAIKNTTSGNDYIQGVFYSSMKVST